MQERRHRPGDVLDDYCPRERRITDHAIVAMIDDEIRRTRCAVCEAEHEYKDAKAPPPRRKSAPVGLFNQVLDGLQGPAARPHSPPAVAVPPVPEQAHLSAAANAPPSIEPPSFGAAPSSPESQTEASADREDGPVRRPLIRAQFPRREGQEPAPRALPEFTVQSLLNRANRPGGHGKGRGRRRPGGGGEQHVGPMRSGRDQGTGFGHGGGGGQGRSNGQGQGHGQGQGGRRRGGKTNN